MASFPGSKDCRTVPLIYSTERPFGNKVTFSPSKVTVKSWGTIRLLNNGRGTQSGLLSGHFRFFPPRTDLVRPARFVFSKRVGSVTLVICTKILSTNESFMEKRASFAHHHWFRLASHQNEASSQAKCENCNFLHHAVLMLYSQMKCWMRIFLCLSNKIFPCPVLSLLLMISCSFEFLIDNVN